MMVVAVGGGVIHAAHVNDNVGLGQLGLVARPHNVSILVFRKETQHGAGQRLVGVERAAVRGNDRGGGWLAGRRRLGDDGAAVIWAKVRTRTVLRMGAMRCTAAFAIGWKSV